MTEFSLIQKGFVERFEIEQRENWERIRWQTYILLQPHVKKNSLRKPKDLIQFPWEKADNTAEMITNNIEMFDRLFPPIINK